MAKTRPLQHLLLWAGVAVLLALVPAFTQRKDILNLIFLIFLNIALAQSWNLLAGYTGQINLGHAAFFGAGAMVTRTLWIKGLNPILGMFAGGVTALALGLIIGGPAFRLRGAYFAIGTLGLAEIFRITVGNLFPSVSTLPAGYLSTYSLLPRYYMAFVLAIAAIVMVLIMTSSRLGLGLMAVREDEDAAQATGVSALKHKLISLSLSTFFAGLAGGTFAFYHASYYPQFPFSPIWTFDALLITFVGGVGTIIGPVVGSVFYVLIKEVLALALVEVHLLIFGSLFVLVVLLLPGGLIETFARLRRLLLPRRA